MEISRDVNRHLGGYGLIPLHKFIAVDDLCTRVYRIPREMALKIQAVPGQKMMLDSVPTFYGFVGVDDE